MERTLVFKYREKEIEFSDLDQDNEMAIDLTDEDDFCIGIYLCK